MNKPRRKPRKCRNCGKALHTSKTGRWFFCDDVCQAQYADEHEPDVDPCCLLGMRPTDEDNYGVSMGDLDCFHPPKPGGE